MESYSAIKKSDTMKIAGKWIEIEKITTRYSFAHLLSDGDFVRIVGFGSETKQKDPCYHGTNILEGEIIIKVSRSTKRHVG